jgi:hypothetical protein
MKKPQTLSHDAWIHALDEIGMNISFDDPNARTTDELAQLWGCSRQQANMRAIRLVAHKLATCIRVVRVGKSGSRRQHCAFLLTGDHQ